MNASDLSIELYWSAAVAGRTDAGPAIKFAVPTVVIGQYRCLRSGVIATALVLERDLMRQILSGDGLGDRDRLPRQRAGWDPWRACH